MGKQHHAQPLRPESISPNYAYRLLPGLGPAPQDYAKDLAVTIAIGGPWLKGSREDARGRPVAIKSHAGPAGGLGREGGTPVCQVVSSAGSRISIFFNFRNS